MNLSDFYHFQRGHGAVVFISTRTWYLLILIKIYFSFSFLSY